MSHLADAAQYMAAAFAAQQASNPKVPGRRQGTGGGTLEPGVVDEFDDLLVALDLCRITRTGWDRLKALLAVAMIESLDDDAGLRGYLRIAPKWTKSVHYDGRP